MHPLFSQPALSARLAAITASGAFFGLTISTSTAIIPVFLDDAQVNLKGKARLRCWIRQFDLCARRWTPISSSSMVFSLLSIFLTPNATRGAKRSLLWLNSASFALQFLLTFVCIFPIKDRLKAQEKQGAPYDDAEICHNIRRWERLHRLRIVGSAVAFASGLVELVGFVRGGN